METYEGKHGCDTCKYENMRAYDIPCSYCRYCTSICSTVSYWKPKENKEVAKNMTNYRDSMNKMKKGMRVKLYDEYGTIKAFDYTHLKVGIELDNDKDSDLCWADAGNVKIVDNDQFTKAWMKVVLNSVYGLPSTKNMDKNSIKNVIFKAPATIVFWNDGTKTVVKCEERDTYDPEKGLAMAIARKALGNKGNYYDIFEKWLPKENETPQENITDTIEDSNE